MPGAGKERNRKARQWAKSADEDLRLAKHGLTLKSSCPYRLIAYHAQQCVEKYLKAHLVLQGIDFPYTHNIARLLELCAESAGWAGTLEDAETLTPYAITTRYPGADEAVSRKEALEAIEIASRARRVIRKELAERGVLASKKSRL